MKRPQGLSASPSSRRMTPWLIASGCHSIAHMWIAAPRSCDVRSICDVRTSVR